MAAIPAGQPAAIGYSSDQPSGGPMKIMSRLDLRGRDAADRPDCVVRASPGIRE